jgi:O-antigen/teichoic acid export membrane protein
MASIMASKSLSKKASLNALASIIDYGARVAVEFIITPLLVAGLGNYLYGLWRILWRLNGYMDAAGGRSAQALKWIVAQDQSLNNYDEKRRYIGGTVAVWFLFLPLLLMFGGLLIWLAPILLKVPEEFLRSAQLTIGLLALNVIVMGLVDIPRAVLQGENLGYKRIGLSTFLVLMGGVLTALAMHFNLGLIGVASATVVATLLTGIMFLWVVGKHVPWFGIAKPSRKTVRWLSGLSGWFVVWKVVSQLMLAGDVVVLGIFDSVALVSIYSLTKYVPETLIKLVTIIVFGIAPGLGGIIGAGNIEKANRVRNEIMSFTWLLLTIAGSVILLWNEVFIQLWVGANFYAGLLATLLIIVLVAQIAFIRNDSNIIDLTLNIRTKVLIGVISEALALSLAALLVSRYHMGIIGVCAGCIAGRSILSVAYPLLVSRFLGIPFYSQLKSILRPIFFTSFLFMIILAGINYEDLIVFEKLNTWLGLNYESAIEFDKLKTWLELHYENSNVFEKLNTWLGLIIGATVTTLTISLLAFYGGLSNLQRSYLLKRIRAITQ